MVEELKKLPKVELHLHLDGSILKETAMKLSGLTEEEVITKMVAPPKCENLSEYLTKFAFPICLMQTKENLSLIAKDLVRQLEKENVIYAEIRFAPLLHTQKGLTLEEVVEAVLSGLEEHKTVKTNLILCMMRGMKLEDNLKIIHLACKYLNQGVCAIDLAGAEDQFPLEEYIELFQIAKEKKIPFTIHAGENGPASEVLKAILIGASRIGHGIHAIDNEEVLKKIKEKNILLEICPTSNVMTNAVESYEKNPIYAFYKRGIPVCINTDNMTVSDIILTLEYMKLSATFPLTRNDYQRMNEIALDHAFVDEKTRETLYKKMKKVD